MALSKVDANKATKAIKDGKAKSKLTQLRPGQRTRGIRKPKEKKPAIRHWEADEVEAIANRLIGQGGLDHMSVLRQAKILYLFTNAERIAGEDVAGATRFNATYAYKPALTNDFVLKVSKPQWDRLQEDAKPAAVYHFLLHFGSDTNGRWRIEPHDFEGFIAEGKHFKQTWNEGGRRARQLGLFDKVASPQLVKSSEKGEDQ